MYALLLAKPVRSPSFSDDKKNFHNVHAKRNMAREVPGARMHHMHPGGQPFMGPGGNSAGGGGSASQTHSHTPSGRSPVLSIRALGPQTALPNGNNSHQNQNQHQQSNPGNPSNRGPPPNT
jgi:hypothetical protein